MNKKNIMLVLIGIMFLVLQFNIRIGTVYIDIFSDIIGATLIAVGGFPLCSRNLVFKKMKKIIILGLVLSVLSLFLSIYGGMRGIVYTPEIVTGLACITLIYFTYYFTEGLMLEATFQEKAAVTRSFRIIWFIFAALTFGSFFAATTNITMVEIIVPAITAIFALYYASAVLMACNQLYMEGLPTKHMDTSKL